MAHTSRRVVALVVASIAVLIGATAALAALHHAARAERVREHFDRGQSLVARGELADAVEEYRAVLSLERDHLEAERALALALLSLGRLSQAETYFSELLRRDPTNGPLNRGVARIHGARGREAEARAAYQRAIYGQWPDDPLAGRIQTRFELLEYLTRLNAREEILAELLRLKSELPPGQTANQRRVAQWLLESGAPDLGIELLRTASVAAPRDVELLAHLADAEATTGRSNEARATLRRAIAIEPGRQDLRARLAVIDRVLALDPTLPRLRLVTRTRRSRQVLAAVFNHTRACLDQGPPDILSARGEAARRLRRRIGADAEAAEQELALAARLWSDSPACHGSSPEARALAQVLQRVNVPEEQQP